MRTDFQRKILWLSCVVALALTGCAAKGPTRFELPDSKPTPLPAKPAVEEGNPGDSTRPKPTLFPGNDQVVRLPARAAPVSVQGEDVSLNFEKAPITDVVHAVMGDLLKLDYSIDQPLKGEVTLRTRAPVARADLIPILESVLQANGTLLVRDARGLYHLGTPEGLKNIAPGPHRVDSLPEGFGTVIVPLRYIGATEMAEILKPLAPAESFLRVDTLRNLIMLAGSSGQIDGWLDIVNSFDVDFLKGMSVGVFPLEHAPVSEVRDALAAMLGSGEGGGGSGPGGGGEGPLRGVVKVIPVERLNSLLVVTPRAHYLEQVRKWVERLDQPVENELEPRLYVYPVQNGSAVHLAALLNGLYGGGKTSTTQGGTGIAPGLASGSFGGSAQSGTSGLSGTATGMGGTGSTALGGSGTGLGSTATGLSGLTGSSSAGGLSGAAGGSLGAAAGGMGQTGQAQQQTTSVTQLGDKVRVVADDQNNALLIMAPRKDYRKIEHALRQLDIAPTQVLIEASIVEVTLKDNLQYGLEWYLQNGIGSGFTGSPLLNMNKEGTIGAKQPGFSYTISNPAGEIRATLNALAEDSLLKVLSNPSILVLDNNTASIHVGDQQPIKNSTTQTTVGTTESITYKDTGVMLSVTPSVNAGGLINMNIVQAVTDVGEIEVATGQRNFMTRQIRSRVAVRSGESVVLGGLIRDNKTQSQGGVPGLYQIPVLGSLFGTTTDSSTRTELLVMITPRALSDDNQLRDVSAELKSRMRGLHGMSLGVND